jgi:hypothetical protein
MKYHSIKLKGSSPISKGLVSFPAAVVSFPAVAAGHGLVPFSHPSATDVSLDHSTNNQQRILTGPE